MREWLTVIIVLLIAGVLLDGWRRMRQSKKYSLKMSRNVKKSLGSKDDDEGYGSELPNGGARVIGARSPSSMQAQAERKPGGRVAARNPLPEQVALNLEEEVPMLMDSVAAEQRARQQKAGETGRTDPALGELSEQDLDAGPGRRPAAATAVTDSDPFGADSDDDDYDDPLFASPRSPAEPEPVEEPSAHDTEPSAHGKEPSAYGKEPSASVDEPPAPASKTWPEPTARWQKAPGDGERHQTGAQEPPFDPDAEAEEGGELEELAEPEEVLVINVMATGGDRFPGGELLEVVLDCGMRFGDMQIFHRHETEDGEGSLLFSMANMVVPGTFDLNAMDEFETPGVSLFMTLPMKANSLDAFNRMADTAKALAGTLGGELKDQDRSIMTAQTLEHCRERIRDFERKRLSRF